MTLSLAPLVLAPLVLAPLVLGPTTVGTFSDLLQSVCNSTDVEFLPTALLIYGFVYLISAFNDYLARQHLLTDLICAQAAK
jgi:hypothetical protein